MMLLALLILASTSAPDKVLMFPDRAQVTRVVALSCGAKTPVVFDHIPSAAAADSFRATVSSGSVDGIRVELVSLKREFSTKAEAATKQMEALQRELQSNDDLIARAESVDRAGRKYDALAAALVAREMVTSTADAARWQAAFDSSLDARLASAQQAAAAKATQLKLKRKEAELRVVLDELRLAQEKKAYTVNVLASCAAGRTASLSLSYLVGGASWTAAYEARALEPTSQVELSTWATVRQFTGEDWNQVELILSTSVPAQNATPPELKILTVTGYERPEEKKVLVRRDEAVERAIAGSGQTQENAASLLASNQGLSVQLKVPQASVVPGDGTAVRLYVGKSLLKASFELQATPKQLPAAFRVAELTNLGAWPLLAGPVDVFRANGLVGRYPLERVAQGAAFRLTFGIEEKIRVARKTVEEVKRDTGLFNGNKRFGFGYVFEVANYDSVANEVTLVDHIPVSELSDVMVAVGDQTTSAYQLDAAAGLIKWKLRLLAGEKKKVNFTFRVDVPNSYDTGGL